ncbi:hypothetical protein A2Z67_06230 [Candidatus Woesebacteria bacterium RBG_13_36_22]|uniref:LysM domain-containing protein n=1 Tax=Candidatus Woesebacteria bacterium RBG_13_36_22 TaxID=1802478 RepID=A0A1F7WZC0_9BACT|nr:MAG: hypothetical protein A2Z67_06230 [Candidatus Woesebacteria bacterium RBG_13_36_22]
MSLKIPYSLPPEKQASKSQVNQDEFESIMSIVGDEDLGVEGGAIDETAQLEKAKERARKTEKKSGDKELTLFDEARSRASDGNANYTIKYHTLQKGEDLRQAALKEYENADGWVLLAAVNNIINPSSDREVYAGRQLLVI